MGVASGTLCGLLIFVVAMVVFYWRAIPLQWRSAVSALIGLSGVALSIYGFTLKGLSRITVSAYFFAKAYTASSEEHASFWGFLAFGAGLLLFAAAGHFSGRLKQLPLTEHIMFAPIALSIVLAVWRFVLEKSAVPNTLTTMIGIVWLPPAVGIYLALELREKKHRVKELLKKLAQYAWAVRLPVVALMLLASFLKLGTHYDISAITSIDTPFGRRTFVSNTFAHHFQLLFVPQLLFWPLYTIFLGWVFGGLAFAFMPRRGK